VFGAGLGDTHAREALHLKSADHIPDLDEGHDPQRGYADLSLGIHLPFLVYGLRSSFSTLRKILMAFIGPSEFLLT
jgi:hypothetical protein